MIAEGERTLGHGRREDARKHNESTLTRIGLTSILNEIVEIIYSILNKVSRDKMGQ